MLYAAGIGNQYVDNPRDAEDGKGYRRPAHQAKAFAERIEGAREALPIQQDAHGTARRFPRHAPCYVAGMARSRGATARAPREPRVSRSTVRVEENCLELDVASAREINVLRRWLKRVNGPAYPQPYLVEEPPGHFRLYIGEAAERVRTRHGML